jgi:hypothetical protein
MTRTGNRMGTRMRAAMAAALLLAGCAASALAADTFTAPTKEELEMKSVPGYPNAAAVVLFREDIARDDMHGEEFYERIKILTEEGKKYANVTLGQGMSKGGDAFSPNFVTSADSIRGRTVHADGTIIPFTGKPYLKTIENTKQYKAQEKVFTLPDVEVGSIVEYRYSIHYTDEYVVAPSWYIQGDLFVRKAHYAWYPTSHDVGSDEGEASAIHWYPILRPQDKFEHRPMPGKNWDYFELTSENIPPIIHEEYMPPIKNFSARVLFSYSPYHSEDEFWSNHGKKWSKSMNSFAGPNGALRDATQKIVAGATSDDEKLQRIYTAVMELENTEYTRERGKREDQANGLSKTDNASDVLEHKRGTPTQLALLFVGMARAAGMQASAMMVPDRSIEIVDKHYESLSQFDDVIAVVTVGGKDKYFDPGSRYEPFGHLAWQHTWVGGLRQADNNASWGQTPGDPYTANALIRVANLTMDDHGEVKGTIILTYIGEHAVNWRQAALRGDEESVRKQLEDSVREMLPKTMELKVNSITGLQDYEKPLVVKFDATGTVGTMSGKRMLLPVDVFRSGAAVTFPHETRELPVYFHYAESVRDAERINLPPTLQAEAVPDGAKFSMSGTAGYALSIASDRGGFTARRDFACNTIMIPQTDYAKLRTFYSQFEAKDQESVVLKQVSAQAAAMPVASPAGK